ncbi:MAG: hypothetical protein HYU67_09320 [Flavobacteriia bacterium]|nr:hypothetical protein [Flavobacteriia bacterium]
MITLIICFIQFRIWKLNQNIIFPIVTIIYYYWSLAGSWLFIFDNMTNYGKKIGLNYHYLLEKMFSVKLDSTYLLTIVFYGLFIIIFQCFIWIGIKIIFNKKKSNEINNLFIQKFDSFPFMFISCICLLGSFFIIKDVVFYSLILEESLYINIRGSQIKYYTIHQYFNWIMIFSLFLYIAIYYKKENLNISVKKPSFIFWIFFIICIIYLISIGSRHETFFSGIFTIIFITFPKKSFLKNWKFYLIFIFLFGIILALNDPIRSFMPRISKKIGLTNLISNKKRKYEANLYRIDRTFSYHHSHQKTERNIKSQLLNDTILYYKNLSFNISKRDLYYQISKHPDYIIINNTKILIPNNHISTAYDSYSFPEKIIRAIGTMVFSNELFAGHFSLYGIIKNKIKPSIGISFNSLFESFKFKKYRNPKVKDSYQYYSSELGLALDQGFTINNISSWIINFSYFGILAGSFFLALIVLIPYYFLLMANSLLNYLYYIVILCSITSFSAMMVRSGPESIKSLLLESIFVPCIILFISISFIKIKNKIFNVNKT